MKHVHKSNTHKNKKSDRYDRVQVVVYPEVQFRYALGLVGLVVCSNLFFYSLVYHSVEKNAAALLGTEQGGSFMQKAFGVLEVVFQKEFFISFAVGLIVVFAFGVLVSNRFAGPIFAIRKHLEKLSAGNKEKPLILRNSDEFHELAQALNNYSKFMEKKDQDILKMIASLERVLQKSRGAPKALNLLSKMESRIGPQEELSKNEKDGDDSLFTSPIDFLDRKVG